MTLWPRDTRRPALMVTGMILLSVGISFAYTFIIEPIEPSNSYLPTEFWRWSTTGLLSLIALLLRFGYKAITKEFGKIGEQMEKLHEDVEEIKESHTNFVLKVTEKLATIEARCESRHGEG